MMLTLIILYLTLSAVSSMKHSSHIKRNNKLHTSNIQDEDLPDYTIPKWVYKSVFKDNMVTPKGLNRLKTRKERIIQLQKYISEYDVHYNTLIACGLPIGLLQISNTNL